MADLKFYEEAYRKGLNDYDLAMREEDLNIQRAEAQNDPDAAASAAQSRASILLQRNQYVAQAHEHAATLRPVASRPFGLSENEIEIAKASHSAGTPEERIRDYAVNKQKYQHMKQTGQIRDDQGTTTRR